MQPTVTAKTACQIAGVKYMNLHQWVKVGLLEPTENPKGSGHLRRFSFRDVLALRLVANLRALGVGTPLLPEVTYTL